MLPHHVEREEEEAGVPINVINPAPPGRTGNPKRPVGVKEAQTYST